MSSKNQMSYDQYYKQILEDESIASILDQNTSRSSNIMSGEGVNEIFTICKQHQIPIFFQSNLLSPNRLIKHIQGESCIFQAFYFQLFKLVFQIQNQQKDYMQIFKQIIFDNKFSNGNSFQAKQFRIQQKCIAQFLQKVIQNQMQLDSFQNYLNSYSMVDQAMVYVLNTFLNHANNQHNQMDSIQAILQYLCQLFEISLVVFQNCFKFQESDVFLYIQQKQNDTIWVYIAYSELLDQSSNIYSSKNRTQQIRQQQNKQSLQQYQKQQSLKQQSLKQSLFKQQPLKQSLRKEQKSQQCQIQLNKNNYTNEKTQSLMDNVITSQINGQSAQTKQVTRQNPNSNGVQNYRYNRIISDKVIQKMNEFNYNQSSNLSRSNELPKTNITTDPFQQINITKPSIEQNKKKPQPQNLSIKRTQNQSSVKSVQNSFQVIDGVSKNFVHYEDPIESQYKTQTIINMFGDMLKSTGNIYNIDHSITHGLVSSHRFIKQSQSQIHNMNLSQSQINNDRLINQSQQQTHNGTNLSESHNKPLNNLLMYQQVDMIKKLYSNHVLVDSDDIRKQNYQRSAAIIPDKQHQNNYNFKKQKQKQQFQNETIPPTNKWMALYQNGYSKSKQMFQLADFQANSQMSRQKNSLHKRQSAQSKNSQQQSEISQYNAPKINVHSIKSMSSSSQSKRNNYLTTYPQNSGKFNPVTDEQLFYHPPSIKAPLPILPSFIQIQRQRQSKLRNSQSKQLDESIDNGMFYNQFSNTKILKLLRQPYKTKVQILRNRFKEKKYPTKQLIK